MGKLDGKVAFITGAARGQGRSHAVRLAEEGADIIGVDICRQLDSVGYAMSTPADLEQTVKEVEALGRKIVARQADVREVKELRKAFDEGTAELGLGVGDERLERVLVPGGRDHRRGGVADCPGDQLLQVSFLQDST